MLLISEPVKSSSKEDIFSCPDREHFFFSCGARHAKYSGIRRRAAFTLIELVVTISIIVLTVSIVAAVFGKESPARALENMELDFRSYCARVRFRACETGRDWVINYDPDSKVFSAAPGKHEKFQMPGEDSKNSGASRTRSEEEEEEDTMNDPENPYSSGNGYSKLEWKLPEKVEFSTEKGEEDTLMTGELLEVFRFFPDGGGSGTANLEFRSGELARIFRISKLTGRLSSIDKAEYEREQMQ